MDPISLFVTLLVFLFLLAMAFWGVDTVTKGSSVPAFVIGGAKVLLVFLAVWWALSRLGLLSRL
jgi:hypothetical protein